MIRKSNNKQFSYCSTALLFPLLLCSFFFLSLSTHAHGKMGAKIYSLPERIFSQGIDTTKPPPPLSINELLANKEQIVFIDGQETANQKIVKSLRYRDINEMKILTPEEATTKYGRKGKKGVIEIATKIDSASSFLNDPRDTAHTIVETPASFPGGFEGWIRYLERNLDSNVPVRNKAVPGKYTVTVSFTINKDGIVNDIKADNDPGYGTAEEAKRMFTDGPNWIPALKGGVKVKTWQKQSITFVVVY